jgi:hypothetical protein
MLVVTELSLFRHDFAYSYPALTGVVALERKHEIAVDLQDRQHYDLSIRLPGLDAGRADP